MSTPTVRKKMTTTVRHAKEIKDLIIDQLQPLGLMTTSCRVNIPDRVRSDCTAEWIFKALKKGRTRKLKERNKILIPERLATNPDRIIHTYPDEGIVLYGVSEPDCDQRAATRHSDMIWYHNRKFDYSPQKSAGVAYYTGHATNWAIIDGVFYEVKGRTSIRLPKEGDKPFYRIEG